MSWLLIITVVSGGAMGGPIHYATPIPYPTQIACEQAAKNVRIQQTTQLAGNNVTHTALVYCRPK
jgi:hypothetical protein